MCECLLKMGPFSQEGARQKECREDSDMGLRRGIHRLTLAEKARERESERARERDRERERERKKNCANGVTKRQSVCVCARRGRRLKKKKK